MSNEVKTKEKVDMDPKYIAKLAVTLLVTCVVVAGLLGFVNKLTLPNITAANGTDRGHDPRRFPRRRHRHRGL